MLSQRFHLQLFIKFIIFLFAQHLECSSFRWSRWKNDWNTYYQIAEVRIEQPSLAVPTNLQHFRKRKRD